jgi:hypothetical protein
MACWYVERRSEPAYLYVSVLRVSRTTPLLIHHASHSCPFFENCSKHHKSPFMFGAVALAIIGFILSFGSLLTIIAGLVSLIIVLCTSCLRVHKVALYIAAVAAVIAAIGSFILAAQPVCNATNVTGNYCNVKLFRSLKIIGGLVWLVAAGLIVTIPDRGATPNQASANTRQTAGDEAA